jgi:hypothetical protein
MKRKMVSEWGLTDILSQRPAGSEIKHYQLDNNTVLIHFKFDSSTTSEELSKFANQVKKVLPSNALSIFTTKAVQIEVNRPAEPPPSSLNMQFNDCVFDTNDAVVQLQHLMEKLVSKGVNAYVNINRCMVRNLIPKEEDLVEGPVQPTN